MTFRKSVNGGKGFSLPRIVKPSTFRTINLHYWERSFISFWDTFPLFCPKCCCPCLFFWDTGRGSQKIVQGLFGFHWDHCIRCLDSVCQFGYWRRQGGRWFGNFGGWILKQPHLGRWLCVVYICVHIYIIYVYCSYLDTGIACIHGRMILTSEAWNKVEERQDTTGIFNVTPFLFSYRCDCDAHRFTRVLYTVQVSKDNL